MSTNLPLYQDNLRAMIKFLHRFTSEFPAKFMGGHFKHGGDLEDKSPRELIREAKNEVLDQWSYLCALEDRIEELSRELGDMRGDHETRQ